MAKLVKQPIRIKPAGMNQLVEPTSLPIGRLTEAFDVVQRRARGTFSKRYGSTALPKTTDGADLSDGRDIIAADGARFIRTKTAVYGRTPGRSLYQKKCLTRNISVPDAPTVMLHGYRPASIEAGGLIYYFAANFGEVPDSFNDTAGVGAGTTVGTSNVASWWFYRVVDAESGVEVVPPTSISTVVGRECRPIVISGKVWAFIGPGNQRKIYAAKFDSASPTTAPVITTFYDHANTTVDSLINDWDVMSDGLVVITGVDLPALTGTSPASDVIARLSVGTGLPSASVGLATTELAGWCCTKWIKNFMPTAPGLDRYFLRFGTTGPSAYLTTIDASSLALISEVTLSGAGTKSHAVGYYDASTLRIVNFTQRPQSSPRDTQIIRNVHELDGTQVTNTTFAYGLALASEPFEFDGAWYILAAHDDNDANLQRGTYLLDAVTGDILGRVLHGEGGDIAQVGAVLPGAFEEGFIPQAPRQSGNALRWATNSWDGAQYVTREAGLDFDDRALRMASVSGRNELVIPGAWPLHIVRSNVVENAPMFPQIAPALTEVDSANSGAAPGLPYDAGAPFAAEMAYAACYCWVYRYENGERLISKPSPIGTERITGANKTFNIVVQPLTIVNAKQITSGAAKAQGSWTIEIYMSAGTPVEAPGGATERDAAEAAAAGETLYLQFSIPNDTNTVPLSFALGQSTIKTNEALYTDGGAELANLAPPPYSLAASWNDRIILAWKNQVWVSKPKREGFGYGFNGRLVLTIPAGKPTITALGMIDAGLFTVHKADGIWLLSGDGPDGARGNDMYKCDRLPFPSGALSQAAMVTTPQGLIYQDANDLGIYLLTRELKRVYIGAGVESYRERVVKGAAYNALTNQVQLITEGTT